MSGRRLISDALANAVHWFATEVASTRVDRRCAHCSTSRSTVSLDIWVFRHESQSTSSLAPGKADLPIKHCARSWTRSLCQQFVRLLRLSPDSQQCTILRGRCHPTPPESPPPQSACSRASLPYAPIFFRCSSTRAASVATSSVSLRQRRGVAFGELADAAGEGLRDAVQFALHGGGERGQPFVVHHQRLDLVLGELGVLGVRPWRRALPARP